MMFPHVYLRFPGGKPKAFTLSYDDGVEQDRRLMAILDRHGLKGTFNLNSGLMPPEGHAFAPGEKARRLSASAAQALFGASGHEIGFHGATHAYWNALPPNRLTQEIAQDMAALEKLFGGFVRGGAYPFGAWSPEAERVLEGCGARYCRLVEPTHGFDLPRDWLALRPTCRHADPELMPLARRFVETGVERQPWLFAVWGHSFEFDADDSWPVMETLAALVSGRDDVYYGTNLQICEYVRGFEQLVFSADGLRVFNPMAQSYWLAYLGQTYELGAGQTLALPEQRA